jgi:hypothetical protein
VIEEKIQDFPDVCEKKQKHSRESAEKTRIDPITTPSPWNRPNLGIDNHHNVSVRHFRSPVERPSKEW